MPTQLTLTSRIPVPSPHKAVRTTREAGVSPAQPASACVAAGAGDTCARRPTGAPHCYWCGGTHEGQFCPYCVSL